MDETELYGFFRTDTIEIINKICYTKSKEKRDIMFDNIEDLKLVSCSQGAAKPYIKVESRKSNAFIFRTGGSGEYDFQGKRMSVNVGEMIFVPVGACYEFRTTSVEECTYVNINFSGDVDNAKPTIYSVENFSEAEHLCSHFTSLWKFGNPSDKYKCYSMFYSVLAYVSNAENLDYSYKKKFEIIEPAIDYLKTNIFNCSLKTDDLHVMCGISDTYFRKIFYAKFATTPSEYIISKRISHAKAVIDSEYFESVGELARSVGYTDPLYFSRAFKKKYGVSPINSIK